MAHTENHMHATTRERGKLQGDQRRSLQDYTDNNGADSMDFGIDMADGVQADTVEKNDASKQRVSTSINTSLSKSTTGYPRK